MHQLLADLGGGVGASAKISSFPCSFGGKRSNIRLAPSSGKYWIRQHPTSQDVTNQFLKSLKWIRNLTVGIAKASTTFLKLVFMPITWKQIFDTIFFLFLLIQKIQMLKCTNVRVSLKKITSHNTFKFISPPPKIDMESIANQNINALLLQKPINVKPSEDT